MRIPLSLQQVFIASNSGEEVNEPPKDNVAFKVFTHRPSLTAKNQSSPKRFSFRSFGSKHNIYSSDRTWSNTDSSSSDDNGTISADTNRNNYNGTEENNRSKTDNDTKNKEMTHTRPSISKINTLLLSPTKKRHDRIKKKIPGHEQTQESSSSQSFLSRVLENGNNANDKKTINNDNISVSTEKALCDGIIPDEFSQKRCTEKEKLAEAKKKKNNSIRKDQKESNIHSNEKSSTSSSSPHPKKSPVKRKSKTISPQQYLDTLLVSRGYTTKTIPTSETCYHFKNKKPSELQIASYHANLLALVRQCNSNIISENDVVVNNSPNNTNEPWSKEKKEEVILRHNKKVLLPLKKIVSCGISPTPCNKFGESLFHYICRCCHYDIFKLFMVAGAEITFSDDLGRLPIHHACWREYLCFDMIENIIENPNTNTHNVHFFHMMDCRGATPLSYVSYEHWDKWIDFLESKKNSWWPEKRKEENGCDTASTLEETLTSIATAAIIQQQLNQSSNSIPDPKNALSSKLASMVVSGALSPKEAIFLESMFRNKSNSTSGIANTSSASGASTSNRSSVNRSVVCSNVMNNHSNGNDNDNDYHYQNEENHGNKSDNKDVSSSSSSANPSLLFCDDDEEDFDDDDDDYEDDENEDYEDDEWEGSNAYSEDVTTTYNDDDSWSSYDEYDL